MDDQQVNSNSSQNGAEPDSMLPPLQMQPPFGDDASMPPEEASFQTIPDERSLVTLPEEAADSDLIEKEWVIKAKQIVDHTSDDPFRQQQELSRLKADYMKKRYNREPGTI